MEKQKQIDDFHLIELQKIKEKSERAKAKEEEIERRRKALAIAEKHKADQTLEKIVKKMANIKPAHPLTPIVYKEQAHTHRDMVKKAAEDFRLKKVQEVQLKTAMKDEKIACQKALKAKERVDKMDELELKRMEKKDKAEMIFYEMMAHKQKQLELARTRERRVELIQDFKRELIEKLKLRRKEQLILKHNRPVVLKEFRL
jgi:hypothetical protein